VEAVVVAIAVAVAFMALVLLVFLFALVLVFVTKGGERHSKVSLYADLKGFGKVGAEVTPLETERKAP
jgi:hypothetical protein